MIAWRSATRDDRGLAAVCAVGAGSAVALGLAFAPVVPVLARLLPGCAFHALTGIPCPACGSTRAGLALLAGDPLVALAWNPLATLGAVVALLVALVGPVWLAAGGAVPRFAAAPAGGLPRPVRVATVAAIVAQWSWLAMRGV